MSATTTTATDTRHPFERRGLGPAPYRLVGAETKLFRIPGVEGSTKPGASCDYCATAITQVYWVKAADGRRFKVGCECIRKAADKGLISGVKQAESARRRKLAEAKSAAVKAELDALLVDAAGALAAMPHPKGWAGRTLLDWVQWMAANAGATGRATALRTARAAMGAEVRS